MSIPYKQYENDQKQQKRRSFSCGYLGKCGGVFKERDSRGTQVQRSTRPPLQTERRRVIFEGFLSAAEYLFNLRIAVHCEYLFFLPKEWKFYFSSNPYSSSLSQAKDKKVAIGGIFSKSDCFTFLWGEYVLAGGREALGKRQPLNLGSRSITVKRA